MAGVRMTRRSSRLVAILSLLVLIPAPSLGVLAYMVWLPDSVAGTVLFFLAKGWILLVPLLVYGFVYRRPITAFRFQRAGIWTGFGLGLLMSLIVVASYLWLGERLIDAAAVQALMSEVGLDQRGPYILMVVYWTSLNSLLEEYVWRWFVVQQALKLMSALPAVLFTALAFTLHHIVSTQLYVGWEAVSLMSTGVFLASAIWSWCFVRFRTIWPGYISHAIVDMAIFAVGYHVIFLQ